MLMWKIVGSIAVLSLMTKGLYKIKRTFENRCPHCGSLRVKTTHYLEPNCGIGYKPRMSWYYDTYTFRKCLKRKCRHLKSKHYPRFLTLASYIWKKIFHRGNFKFTDKIEGYMIESGYQDRPRTSSTPVKTIRSSITAAMSEMTHSRN